MILCYVSGYAYLLLRPWEWLRSIVMSMSVCVCVCLFARISPEPHERSLPNFLCVLPMSVARSSGTLTIGRIACRREGVFFPIDNTYISLPHVRSLPNLLCMMLVSMVWSSPDSFTIGCIAYRQEEVFFPLENALSAGKGGWECKVRVKYAIYGCLVLSCMLCVINMAL